MQAIEIVVEDSNSLFDNEDFYQLVNSMIPNIFSLLSPNQSEKIKENAIITVNMLLLTQASLIQENMEGYTKHLITMQNDPSQQVRWRIVQGINAVMELRLDIIMGIFEEVANLMINALTESDQKVALAATEFWSGVIFNHCEDQQKEDFKIKSIHQKLPQLMVALL